MKIMITGDSHTGALRLGRVDIRKTDDLRDGVDIWVMPLGSGTLLTTPFFEDCGDHARLVPCELSAQFQRLPPKGYTMTHMGLSMPLWPMRVVQRMIDGGFALAGHHGKMRPVTRAVFRQIVLRDQTYVLDFINVIRRSGPHPLAVSGPGLFRDHLIFNHAAPEVVLPLFNTYREIMMAELAARNVPIVDIPAECLDDDGFMQSRFRHPNPKDAHHGNVDYGRMMIRAVEAWGKQELARAA